MTCVQCGAERPGDKGTCPSCSPSEGLADVTTIGDLYASAETTGPESSPRPAAGFAPGQSFGDRFTIVEEIGAGGMGKVYKAIDRRVGQTVALKLIRPEAAAQSITVERFLRELSLAREVTHPNVCRVYDLDEEAGFTYISMEYVEGQTLDALTHSFGHLSPKQTVAIARQICSGLEAIHQRHIVHRDLKPGNIMVDRAGHAILMDFGLAYHHGQDHLTGVGTVMGTLAYLSPEQARGKPTDARSDIYALGLVLFEMLTGQRAPADGGPVPLALRESGDRCPPPSRLMPEISPELDGIVLRCLERDPEKRFATARDAEQALAQAAGALSTVASVHSRRIGPLARPGYRRGVLAAGLVLALSLGAWELCRRTGRCRWPGQPAQAQRPVVALLPIANLGDQPADQDLAVGLADLLVGELAKTSCATVVPRSAMARYEQDTSPVSSIAKELGLTHVVKGAVKRSGSKLRLSLSLVRANGTPATAIDYEDVDTFAVTRRAGDALGAALCLGADTPERPSRPPTSDVAAFADYSRGLRALDRHDIAGNVDAAIASFQSAIQRDPRFALAHAALGEAYWAAYEKTKDSLLTTSALKSVTQALTIDPDEPRVRVALARIQSKAGQGPEAIDQLQRALALAPRDDEAHQQLGEMLSKSGQTEPAVAEIRQAIAIRPRYPAHYAALGGVYFTAGRWNEAIEAFQQVVELQPDNAQAFQRLGASYQAAGNPDAALEHYQKAISVAPDSRAYSNMGTIYYDRGQFAEAAKAYQKAVEIEPKRALTHRNLGDAFERQGLSERARSAWREAIRLGNEDLRVNPSDAPTLALVAVCEAKLGHQPEADRAITTAVALAPKDNRVRFHLARVHALAGRLGEGLRALDQALDLGYNATTARNDWEIRALRNQPGFQEIIERRR